MGTIMHVLYCTFTLFIFRNYSAAIMARRITLLLYTNLIYYLMTSKYPGVMIESYFCRSTSHETNSKFDKNS